MTTAENNNLEDEVVPEELTSTESVRIAPIGVKISRFGPSSGSKFGKGATNFNPPNKQRPGRAAGRGR